MNFEIGNIVRIKDEFFLNRYFIIPSTEFVIREIKSKFDALSNNYITWYTLSTNEDPDFFYIMKEEQIELIIDSQKTEKKYLYFASYYINCSIGWGIGDSWIETDYIINDAKTLDKFRDELKEDIIKKENDKFKNEEIRLIIINFNLINKEGEQNESN